MKLYDNPASPFCRKVQVLAHETGLINDIEMAHAVGHALASEKMPTAENPLGKIPTMVLPDGKALFDSRVICRYLDDLSGNRMYPKNRLFDVLTTEALADGVMDAAVLMIYEGRCRPDELQFADWVEGQWARIERALDHLEANPLPGGFDADHIAVACALGYLDFRLSDRDWRSARPGLSAWFTEVSERPSVARTSPSA